MKINFARCLPQLPSRMNLLNPFPLIIWQQMLCNYVDICDKQMCACLCEKDVGSSVRAVAHQCHELYDTSDININSQMSKEKRYILVRDVVRIDYFIQRIIPTEDVYTHCPMRSRKFRGMKKIASLMDAKPETSEVCNALRYKENDKPNKKMQIHSARVNSPFLIVL